MILKNFQIYIFSEFLKILKKFLFLKFKKMPQNTKNMTQNTENRPQNTENRPQNSLPFLLSSIILTIYLSYNQSIYLTN